MDIGLQALGTIFRHREEPPEAGFRRIREAGFDAVDFNFELFVEYDSLFLRRGECFYDRSLEELQSFFLPYREACRAEGLYFSQGHAPFCGYIDGDPEGFAHFTAVQKKVIALAGWMGIPCLVIHPLQVRQLMGKEREIELNLAWYRELAPEAEKAGLTICLENLFDTVRGRVREGACSDPEEVRYYMDALNQREIRGRGERQGEEDSSDSSGETGKKELFGFCLDVGHVNLFGRDMSSFIMTVGKDLKILHLHENDGIHDQHGMPFTWNAHWGAETNLDWKGVIRGLREIGYRGVLNFEAGPVMYAVPEEMNSAARQFIHAAGVYLSDQIEKGR